MDDCTAVLFARLQITYAQASNVKLQFMQIYYGCVTLHLNCMLICRSGYLTWSG